jgi:hypothetical protein
MTVKKTYEKFLTALDAESINLAPPSLRREVQACTRPHLPLITEARPVEPILVRSCSHFRNSSGAGGAGSKHTLPLGRPAYVDAQRDSQRDVKGYV